jgi:hypothetical protein
MAVIERLAIGGLNANGAIIHLFWITAVTRRQLGMGLSSGVITHGELTGLL